jgi:hypothetical protein
LVPMLMVGQLGSHADGRTAWVRCEEPGSSLFVSSNGLCVLSGFLIW